MSTISLPIGTHMGQAYESKENPLSPDLTKKILFPVKINGGVYSELFLILVPLFLKNGTFQARKNRKLARF